MRSRFPLYARILLWFFLNLAIVVVVLLLAFRVQFRLGLDWLLAGDAANRIEAVSYLILTELSDRPRPEWNEVLTRFSSAYQLQFYAFDEQSVQLAGEKVDLPPEVRARLNLPRRARRGPTPRAPPQPALKEEALVHRLPPAAPEHPRHAPPPPPPHVTPHASYPMAIVRTANPTRYWIIVRAGTGGVPLPAARPLITLVAMSTSLSGGGLLFDWKPWLTAGASVLLLSALLWFPLVRGITRSIGQMTEATGQMAQGRFDVRVDARRRDELGILGAAINQMALRLSGFVSGQKRFLGDIAHELCSPLARLRVALGILEQRAGEAERPYVNAACEKAEQIAGLVNELLSFSRASLGGVNLTLKPVRLIDAVRQACQQETRDSIRLEVNVPEQLQVQGEPDLLVRAFANIVRNAIRYAGDAGPIQVSAQPNGREVCLTVTDSGPGIPEDQLAKVFDPFYRVDTSRDRSTGGVGLGLTIVKTCIEACGGTVVCRNRQPHGLAVVVSLPGASFI